MKLLQRELVKLVHQKRSYVGWVACWPCPCSSAWRFI